MRTQKDIRAHEVEDKYRPRLHRTVGVYLALKAWTHGFDCIVLNRNDLLAFFDMKATPGDRMEQIRRDLKPWFQGFIPSCRQPSSTFVKYLFLVREAKDTLYFDRAPSSPSGVKMLIEKLNKSDDPKAPKTAFFSRVASEGGVSTQEKLLSELVLLVSGLEPPKVKAASAVTNVPNT